MPTGGPLWAIDGGSIGPGCSNAGGGGGSGGAVSGSKVCGCGIPAAASDTGAWFGCGAGAENTWGRPAELSATSVEFGENNWAVPACACRPCSTGGVALCSSNARTPTSNTATMPDPTTNAPRFGGTFSRPRAAPARGRFVVAMRARSLRDCDGSGGAPNPDATHVFGTRTFEKSIGGDSALAFLDPVSFPDPVDPGSPAGPLDSGSPTGPLDLCACVSIPPVRAAFRRANAR